LLKLSVLAKELGISILSARDFISSKLIQGLALPGAGAQPQLIGLSVDGNELL
jgi:hypothetical protein